MKDQSFKPLASASRTIYFDWLKVFEYLMLMIVHTASYQWYTTSPFGTDWLVLNFYKSATRPCVLVFFMISGALMLGREIPIRVLYKKYVLRLAIAFLFWDAVYAVVTYFNDGISGIIFKFFNSNYHLWYLLAMIGLYICFPLMRLIAENKKVMTYFLIVSSVFAFLLPTIITLMGTFGGSALSKFSEIINGHLYSMHIYTVLGYPFFFLAGYYIHTTDIPAAIRRIIYALGIFSVIFGATINAVYVRMIYYQDDLFNSGFMLYEMISALAVFTFFKYNIKGTPFLNRICSGISGWGLGIYVLHDFAILSIDRFFGLNAMSFNPIIAVPAVAAIAFVLSVGVSALLKLIPGVGKYLV